MFFLSQVVVVDVRKDVKKNQCMKINRDDDSSEEPIWKVWAMVLP